MHFFQHFGALPDHPQFSGYATSSTEQQANQWKYLLDLVFGDKGNLYSTDYKHLRMHIKNVRSVKVRFSYLLAFCCCRTKIFISIIFDTNEDDTY